MRKKKHAATGRYVPRRAPGRSGNPSEFHALCKLVGQFLGLKVVPTSPVSPGDGMPPLFAIRERADGKLALPVLKRAYRLVRSGWVRNFHELYPVGHKVPERGPVWPLWRALATGTLAGEHAKRIVRRAIGSLDIAGWEADPHRTRRDVLHALSRAIEMCGALGPPEPRRGGWVISVSVATSDPSRSTPRKPRRTKGVRK